MTTQAIKILALPLLVGTLLFTACGEKSGAPAEAAETKIPDAPDEAMQMIAREIADANGAILWRAMPGSYQSDVTSIARLAGTKIDPDIYNKVFSTVNRVATVLDKQKEFVFNTSLGGEGPDEEQVARMRAAWPSIMDLVNELTTSSLSSAEGLQSFEGEAFFRNTVSGVLANVDALTKLQPDGEMLLSDLKEASFKYLEGSGSEATLEMSVPGQETETRTFVKVEDRWVPQDMAQTWAADMAQARSQLEAIDPKALEKQKPQILGVFAMIDGVLTQIEAAETQQQFDQALQGAMMPIMGLMMMGQGMGGAGSAPQMPAAPELPEMPPADGMPNLPTTPE